MQTDTTPPQPAYIGFWKRVGASLIDTILILMIIGPVLWAVYGTDYFMLQQQSGTGLAGAVDFLLSWVFPAVAVVLFWIARSATPGKMLIGAVIVDADTLGKPSVGQFIGRYLGYFVSTIPLGLGLLWVAFDRRKQGWHDKLAGTLVISQWPSGLEENN